MAAGDVGELLVPYMPTIRVPKTGDRVYKTECAFSYDSPVSNGVCCCRRPGLFASRLVFLPPPTPLASRDPGWRAPTFSRDPPFPRAPARPGFPRGRAHLIARLGFSPFSPPPLGLHLPSSSAGFLMIVGLISSEWEKLGVPVVISRTPVFRDSPRSEVASSRRPMLLATFPLWPARWQVPSQCQLKGVGFGYGGLG